MHWVWFIQNFGLKTLILIPLVFDRYQGYLLQAPQGGKRWGMDESILKEVSNMNLYNWLWAKIDFFVFKHKISKFIKLAKIACVQVLGFVEVEHCFFGNNIYEKQLEKLLDIPFGFEHSILSTVVLHTWELPIWWGRQPMGSAKE